MVYRFRPAGQACSNEPQLRCRAGALAGAARRGHLSAPLRIILVMSNGADEPPRSPHGEEAERCPQDKSSGSIQGLFGEAARRYRAGRLDEAERLYRRILAIDPRHADSLHLLGVLAHQAGRHDTAIELIGQAVRLRGDDPFYHQNLGLALQAQARLGDAAACFERALALKPEAHIARRRRSIRRSTRPRSRRAGKRAALRSSSSMIF